MLKPLLMFVVLLAGCGKDGGPGFSLPADTATPEERQKINQALKEIQQELDANGVKERVDRLQVVVAELDKPNLGRCYRDMNGRGLGIVMTKDVLALAASESGMKPWYFTVLLHEIGHCYFNREHEDELIMLENQELVFPRVAAGALKREEYSRAWLAPSVMNVEGERMLMKELVPYYVKEIAGLERIHGWQDLSGYLDVTIRRRGDTTRW